MKAKTAQYRVKQRNALRAGTCMGRHPSQGIYKGPHWLLWALRVATNCPSQGKYKRQRAQEETTTRYPNGQDQVTGSRLKTVPTLWDRKAIPPIPCGIGRKTIFHHQIQSTTLVAMSLGDQKKDRYIRSSQQPSDGKFEGNNPSPQTYCRVNIELLPLP